jgi:predicted RNA-binding Zn-ribbon protein involved in translation (DUF1610 family)
MPPETIPDAVLNAVDPQQREAFQQDYQALATLAEADCDLQPFLDDYLQSLLRLYAAQSGAIWFRAVSSDRLTLKTHLGMQRLKLANGLEEQHQDLLRFALSRTNAFLVEPFSAANARATASNPTDSFLLLGPVVSQGDRVAIVELFLGPSPARGKTAAECARYVTWLDHLLSFLCQGIESRFLGNLAPLQPALVNLAATRAEIEAFKNAIQVSLEITLNSFAGSNFGSLQNNKTFTRTVQELLDSNGLRVECPECGSPAILRCQRAGNSRTGVFLYDHYLENGRTFHGGPSTFPRLKLVARPPRRKGK